MLWNRIANYHVLADTDVKTIYPENKDGKRMPVRLIKSTLRLRHITNDGDHNQDILLSRYRHRGRWFWRDSRDRRSCTRDHIVGEVSRMLRLDGKAAEAFVNEHLVGV